MSQIPAKIQVMVKSITHEASGICSIEFRSLDGKSLPAFTAGAHIDLDLGKGLVRSYSLVNPQDETHRYVIAVNKDRNSRGGSRYIHERLRVGDSLTLMPPANNFPLEEAAAHSIFIAGGIGITPIWSMIQRLVTLGRSWELHYACRAAEFAAFLEPISAAAEAAGAKLDAHLDSEARGTVLDLQAIVAAAPADSLFYCCGPAPMLEAYKDATKSIEPSRVRLEHFAPAAASGEDVSNFTVVLARSGREFVVEEGMTILETLLQNGVSHNYSCTQGVCGTCETGVIEGTPDHRDWVMSDDKKQQNKAMMICCSLSKTSRLVLDL